MIKHVNSPSGQRSEILEVNAGGTNKLAIRLSRTEPFEDSIPFLIQIEKRDVNSIVQEPLRSAIFKH
jgi:hypothetical protein